MSGWMIIRYSEPDVHKPQPWPIGLEKQTDRVDHEIVRWVVTSGLGPDDGAILVGFGDLGRQYVTVFPDAAVADPSLVVGLAATFSKDGGFFEWKIPVAELQLHSAMNMQS